MIHALARFCTWLSNTALAHALQTSTWLIPALQTVHILAVAVLISAIFLLSLRLLGLAGLSQSREEAAERLAPAILAPVPVLLLTGLLQIAAEPERSLLNYVFWLKMGFLAAGLALFFLYRRRARKTDSPAGRYVFAVASLALWVAVVFAGRLIAYAQ